LKKKYKLILVAGARPNFMKVAPIIRSLKLRAHPGEIRCDKLNTRCCDFVNLTRQAVTSSISLGREDGGQMTDGGGLRTEARK